MPSSKKAADRLRVMREPKLDPRFKPSQRDIDALAEADDEMMIRRTSQPPSQPRICAAVRGRAVGDATLAEK